MIKKIKLTTNITKVNAAQLLSVEGQVTSTRDYAERPDYMDEYSVLYFQGEGKEFSIYRYLTGQTPAVGLKYLGTVMLFNTEYVEHYYSEQL